jgi:hypothetical protein
MRSADAYGSRWTSRVDIVATKSRSLSEWRPRSASTDDQQPASRIATRRRDRNSEHIKSFRCGEPRRKLS